MEMSCLIRQFGISQAEAAFRDFSMRERSTNVTPPLADFLKKLERNRLNFDKSKSSADGWVAPADDGNGYVVRLWDKYGPTVDHCPTYSEVILRLTKIEFEAESRQYVARQISKDFYQQFFEAVSAKPPGYITADEAKLCGLASKISMAMVPYTDILRETAGRQSPPDAVQKLRASSLTVDRLIKRANALYEKLRAEAAIRR
jgi:hypothetical protein